MQCYLCGFTFLANYRHMANGMFNLLIAAS